MPELEFPDFPSEFRGAVLRPGDPDYAAARKIPNCRHDERLPGLIAQCVDVDDVVTVVNYARENDIPVAVRSGGHGIDGYSMPHDALVIDLSRFKGIDVDPERRVARVEAGCLLGEMDAATQEHGLVVPSGTVSETGVAGLALGGGMGYISRKYGMTVDNMLACEVVTMDGRTLRCTEEENADLFWGLRGAGHNLAIATAFEFRAHPVGPEVTSGLIIYPIEQAKSILMAIDEHLDAAPRDLTVYPVVLPAPPLPGLPEALVGVPICVLIVVYVGPPEQADEIVAGVAALGEPMANMVGPSTWMQANSILDVLAPPGRRQHNRGGYLPGMSEEVVDIVLERVMNAPAPTGPGPSCAVAFPALGAAVVEDFDEDSKAFSRTDAMWLWEALGQWDPVESDEEYDGWVDSIMDQLKPHSNTNGYVNLSTHQGMDWLAGLYGSEEKWQRILALKDAYDPQNLLRYNKNVLLAEVAA